MYSDISDMNSESGDSNQQKKPEMEKKTVKRSYGEKDNFSGSSDSDEEIAAVRKRKKSDPIKKYNTTFLSFGFIENMEHKTPRPQCLICGAVLPNAFLKLSKLRRHFMTKHAELSDKPTNFFESNLDALKMKKMIPE